MPGEHRVHDDAVLVDQPQLLERERQHRAAHEHAFRRLLFELLHGLGQIALDADGIDPREVAARG